VRRREFITLLSSVAASWPVPARAQQPMPVVGYLDPRSPDAISERLRAFRQGLKEAGFVEGENVAIERAELVASSIGFRRRRRMKPAKFWQMAPKMGSINCSKTVIIDRCIRDAGLYRGVDCSAVR
jgi:hypothetical protein